MDYSPSFKKLNLALLLPPFRGKIHELFGEGVVPIYPIDIPIAQITADHI